MLDADKLSKINLNKVAFWTKHTTNYSMALSMENNKHAFSSFTTMAVPLQKKAHILIRKLNIAINIQVK